MRKLAVIERDFKSKSTIAAMNEIERLKLDVKRERKARLKIKDILVKKVLELDEANQKLRVFNEKLEGKVAKTSQEVIESEFRYRTLVETAQEIIYNISVDGYFTYMNSVALSLFGYEDKDIVGKHFTEFIPEGNRQKVLDFYQKFRIKQLKKSYLELPVKSKNGDAIWLGQNVQRVELNGTIYYSAFARDISERIKNAKEISLMKDALAKSEMKYRSMIENMDLGILEVDLEGTIINVYDGFCQMCGFRKEDLLGKNAMDFLVPPEFHEKMRLEDEKRMVGESGHYEIKINHKDGIQRWVIVSGSPFHDEEGNITGSAGIHYDITDRKHLETALVDARLKAEESQAAEQLFLANMSHEIRTPLNAIIGMTHVLSESQLDEEQDDLVKIILHSSNLLHSLINDILDVSKIDSGSMLIRSEEFNLIELLHKIRHTFAVKAREKELEIKLEIEGELKNLVHSDSLILNQILMNLMGNAEKFTDHGEICLHVEIGNKIQNKIPVLFEVRDTGIGISSDQLNSIFEKFMQVSMSSTKRYGGTGLGLNITQKLLGLMGSQIDVESIMGEGSTFRFALQFEDSDKPIPDNMPESAESVEIRGLATKHILVAEDNVINQKYLGMLLAKANITFEIAKDGVEAVALAKKSKYDLILMDIQMPKMDGFDATRNIRLLKEHRITPIIGITAMTVDNSLYIYDDSGIDEFVAKPYTPQELYASLQHFLVDELSFGESTTQKASGKFVYSKGLDASFLRESYDDDIEYAVEIFSTFLETTKTELESIKGFISADDQQSAQKVVHRIKPTFRMVGLPTCTVQCAHLEEMAENDWPSFKENFEKLLEQYPERKKGVEAELIRMREFLEASS